VVFGTDGGEEGSGSARSLRSYEKGREGGRRRGEAMRKGRGRAIIEEAVFALNVSMVRSKGDWLWG
jgi:hypothetical protein